MKAKLLLVCVLATVLLGLVACSRAAPTALSVDITKSGQQVTLANGGTLTITLDSNVTTGYSWNQTANITDTSVLQQTDHKYVNPTTPAIGAGGQEVWTVQALKTGTSTISMEYRRPFEPASIAPAKTFSLTVVVQ